MSYTNYITYINQQKFIIQNIIGCNSYNEQRGEQMINCLLKNASALKILKMYKKSIF